MRKALQLEFETEDKLKLPGLLFEPNRKTDKALLVLHGCGSTDVFYSVEKNNLFAQKLNRAGIAYFPFNNRGAHYIKSLKKTNDRGEEEKVYYGTAYELIKDCLIDIDSALDFLEKRGYREFYLLGYSTGANKICVYSYYRPKNRVAKYVLAGGGDDTGLYYQEIGDRETFWSYLKRAKYMINRGQGTKIIPKYMVSYPFSYQSFYDVCNPDGDYNVFPFLEYQKKLKLSKKPLFREYKSLNKPTLVVYGEFDEYTYGNAPGVVEILKKEKPGKAPMQFEVIGGADHGFSDHADELSSLVANWLIE